MLKVRLLVVGGFVTPQWFAFAIIYNISVYDTGGQDEVISGATFSLYT